MNPTSKEASPFPGMDPFLEDAEIWLSFHHRLANEVADQLNAVIVPKYYADVSVRVVGEAVAIGATHTSYPDVSVLEHAGFAAAGSSGRAAVAIPPAPVRRVAIVPEQTRLRAVYVYAAGSKDLVTAIEILSPVNKRRGEGLDEYRAKRIRILNSRVHLMELDLLRAGERPGPEVLDPPLDADYVLLVNRFREDGQRVSEIWPVELGEVFPLLPVPLLDPDPDAVLDLNSVVGAVYARARYGYRLDYRRPVPLPDLRHDTTKKVQGILDAIG